MKIFSLNAFLFYCRNEGNRKNGLARTFTFGRQKRNVRTRKFKLSLSNIVINNKLKKFKS